MTDTAPLVTKALLAGTKDLLRHTALLNAINVFPVMDGDTGVNLRATLQAVASREPTLPNVTLRGIRTEVTKPLLRAARGNSGIILAEFLAGVMDGIWELGGLSLPAFVDGVARGRERAYKAVAEPIEGTMLTLMTTLYETLMYAETPFTMVDHGLLENRLLDAVLYTPKQLDTLASAGVVDAGALGFYFVAAGLTLSLAALFEPEAAMAEIDARRAQKRGASIQDVANRILPDYIATAQTVGVAERFCVNLVITAPADAKLQEALVPHGSSLNIAHVDNLFKIHIHSNSPDAVKAAAAKFGDVTESVVQDMRAALAAAGGDQKQPPLEWIPVRIAADSAISLHPDTASALGIERIDNYINIAGEMVSDRAVDMVQLLREMEAGAQFTTTQVSPDRVKEFLERVLPYSGRLLFIAVGDAYTGTQNTVRRVAAEHPGGERVTVLDSVAASGQQGLICYKVQQYATLVGDFDGVVAYAKQQIEACKEYLFIPDLKYLKRTGRIGTVKAAFASALSIKPIVGHGPKGAITVAKVKSEEAAVHEIIRRIQAHPGDGPLTLMVEYTDNEPFARTLKKTLHSAFGGNVDIVLAPLSSSSSVHMGPGTWGIAVTRD